MPKDNKTYQQRRKEWEMAMSEYEASLRQKESEKFKSKVSSGISDFGSKYVAPAMKTALGFSPIGPVIGLTDAYDSYKSGDKAGAVIGAGMEALPMFGKGILATRNAWRNVVNPNFVPKTKINWAVWNKDIPANKELMREYSDIERLSKKNGTWMKNPDGTDFPGDPRTWIQMQSNNFKRAFGNTKLLTNDRPTIGLHETDANFSEFDINKMKNMHHGRGIYFTPEVPSKIGLVNKNPYISNFTYGKNKIHAFLNSTNPNYTANRDESLNFGYDFTGKDYPHLIGKTSNTPIIGGMESMHVIPDVQNIKSAIGNNGMFDMTNPNIYKSILPVGIVAGTAYSNSPNKFFLGGPAVSSQPTAGLQRSSFVENQYKQMAEESVNASTAAPTPKAGGFDFGATSGLAGLASNVISSNVSPTSKAGGIASGALSGAAAGAAAGPIGAGVGALIGGVSGLLGANKAAKEQELMENKAARDAYAAGTKDVSPYAHVYAMGGPKLTEFNEGGSHEENPNGGIPQGINQSNGQANLVEEGETKHKDYIFSDRLKLKNPQQFNLGGNLSGKTFADISKKLSKIASERPNDPIAQRGQEMSLNRLKMANDDAIAINEYKNSQSHFNREDKLSGSSFKYGGFIFTDY